MELSVCGEGFTLNKNFYLITYGKDYSGVVETDNNGGGG